MVTFNTGTTLGLAHDADPEDGYSSVEAAISDEWYGDGLAWRPVVEDARLFFEEQQPDIVAFQEIFWSGDCANMPEDSKAGFVCEDWQAGDATVAQVILGTDYQIACHPDKSDKCVAVHEAFGSLRGCESGFCLDGLDGVPVDDCGSGARVARALIDLPGGEVLTVVNLHGSSGLDASDKDCRLQQFAQVFEDMDGAPAADGKRNIILGDLNTDPARSISIDASAEYIATQGNMAPFAFVTDDSAEAEPTYQGLLNIDHVISDAFVGECVAAGIGDLQPVSEIRYFDHLPLVCDLTTKP